MKIALLLDSVSQDQKASVESDVAFHGWMHGPAAGGDGESGSNRVRLPKYSLRKEAWGGVFVYGPTQSVYHVDDEAFGLLLRLKDGESSDIIAAQSKAGEDFIAAMKTLAII